MSGDPRFTVGVRAQINIVCVKCSGAFKCNRDTYVLIVFHHLVSNCENIIVLFVRGSDFVYDGTDLSECLAFKPEKGRYANVTTFLDAKTVEEDTFLTRVLPTPEIVGIMVMCDGTEVCMIDLASNKPAPIVGQMLEDYSKDEVDRHTVLSYLTGMRWMTDPRGGDDKSIALLACRRANQ